MNNILIVEDDTLIAGDIESTLKRLGHGVSGIVSSGEEALRSAAGHPPDLAIMDIKLKGKIDGVETATRLRRTFHVPVIYLTAHADQRTLNRTRYTEPYGYIIKPFREEALRAAIEMASYKAVMDGAVRANEARFRTILESAPAMVWMAGKEGDCSYVNPAWLAFTGSSAAKELGRGWMRNVHPEDLRRSLQVCQASFEAKKPFRLECRLRRHDGVYRWVEGSGVPIYSPDRVFEGYVGACADVHDRAERGRRP